jgi:RNA polymerase sigma factor (sigma-70 family)
VSAIDSSVVAFEAFYTEHLPFQVRRAYLLVGSNELANDIVHDAMIGVFRRWASMRDPAAYLSTAVLNGCRDSGRRRTRQDRLVTRIAAHPTSTTDPHDVLDDVLAALPFQQRAAVVLRYFEQRSTAEIATALGCSPGSVGPWIDRALTKMRKALS